MTKIMLVEDDKSLREIYGVRLLAEGYDIVTAGDGEEALAMAIKERPQLIISDVMMPKISGFDFLDILRSTTETKNIKVIMMTALSSEEQRQRGESLGADRYLVKSQVGIEDVVRIVHEVVGDTSTASATAPATPAASSAPNGPGSSPLPTPSLSPAPLTAAVPSVASAVQPSAPVQTSPTPQPSPLPTPTPPSNSPKPPQARSRIIEPLNDPSKPQVNIDELVDKELAKEAGVDSSIEIPVPSTEQERASVTERINQFTPPSSPQPTAPADIPTVSIDASGNIGSEMSNTSATDISSTFPQPGANIPPANTSDSRTPPIVDSITFAVDPPATEPQTAATAPQSTPPVSTPIPVSSPDDQPPATVT